jgi:hypothetical protein
VLSTPLTCGIAGRAEGIPADLPDRWYADPAGGDYGVTIHETRYTADARPCDAATEVLFAHKTGLCYTQKIPRMAKRIDDFLEARLES